MKQTPRTIPSEFIRLDSAVTSADTFINVRDEQTKRLNHNILAARSIRRPILMASAFTSRQRQDAGATNYSSLQLMLEAPLWVSQQTREVEFYIQGAQGIGADLVDCWYYPVISINDRIRPPDPNERITLAYGSSTHNGTITVPHNDELTYGAMLCNFRLYYATEVDTAAPRYNAVAISAVTNNTITVAQAATSADMVNHVCVFTTATTTEPAVVLSVATSGANYVLTFAEDFVPANPVAGVDTVHIYSGTSFIATSIGLSEKPVTDFNATYGAS